MEDAILCHKILDLNWMGDKRNLHVGFPEVSLAKYAKMLVDKGFKVCVVDQIDPHSDSSANALADTQDAKHGTKGKPAKKQSKRFQGREIVAVLSKGLFTVSGSDLSYEA